MNCPVCGSEIPAGVKYCSVCGTDVEGAQLRAQQASAPSSPQRPAHGAPQQPQGRAVPMNPSMPPQQAAAGARGFDTSKMNGSPKWPIVLICVLVVVIVAVVLLIFHPWSQGGDSPTAEGPTTSNVETVTPVSTEGGEGDAGSVSETPQDATAAGLSDADAYTQLSAIYGQFAGFNDRMQGVVDYFNTYFPDGADAATLQATVDAFNASVDSGEDPLGRTLFANKLENGPWVATPRQACVHHTMGGVTIDTSGHVMDTEGAPIAGLYAAGEVTGGIHGGNRLGGNAVVDTVVFGRLAATTLASEA